MKCQLGGTCSSTCECNRPISEQGAYSLKDSTWNSTCPNRKRRVECAPHHTCDNTRLTTQKTLSLDKDLMLTLSWGVDLFTRSCIFSLLGHNYIEYTDSKNNFIDLLIKVSNLMNFEGWNIRGTCQKLRELIKDPKSRQKYGIADDSIQQFWIYCRIIEDIALYKCARQGVRFFSKGIGVICMREEGIKCNELVIEYLGEVYSACQWYEKQDAIKMFMIAVKKKKLKKKKQSSGKELTKYFQEDSVPEFYNIMLEKVAPDPDGYDILFVDPTYKGNYSSRFSHSCVPNCGTVTMVANNKYTIGMFAIKDISFGEELTFDYCSFTESEKEYKNSLCLCGNFHCKGNYLGYSRKQIQLFGDVFDCKNVLIDTSNEFFVRMNSNILLSCIAPLETEDIEILERQYVLFNISNFKQSLLGDSPDWLKKWTAITLREIVQENQIIKSNLEINLPKKFSGVVPQDKLCYFNIETQSLLDMRIMNLAISLDKINIFLQKSQPQAQKQPDTPTIAKKKSRQQQKNGMANPNDISSQMFSLDISKHDSHEMEKSNSPSRDSSVPFSMISAEDDEQLYWSSHEDSHRTTISNFVLVAKKKTSSEEDKKLLESVEQLLKVKLASLRNELINRLVSTGHLTSEQAQIYFSSKTPNKIIYRRALLYIGSQLKKLRLFEFHPAIADVLILHSFNSFIFRSKSYSSFDQHVDIRECDLTLFEKYLQNSNLRIEDESKVVHTQVKKYSCNYLWGQLVFWMKQTIERPDASLSQGRRGTLNLPDFEKSFLRFIKSDLKSSGAVSAPSTMKLSADDEEGMEDNSEEQETKKVAPYPAFPFGTREKWLNSMKCKPSDSWPTGDGWKYEKNDKYALNYQEFGAQ